MPSPFPGMDPYLEDPVFWPGCHTTLLTAVRAALTPQLPPGYFAELEQHIWFHTEDTETFSIVADKRSVSQMLRSPTVVRVAQERKSRQQERPPRGPPGHPVLWRLQHRQPSLWNCRKSSGKWASTPFASAMRETAEW